MNDEIFLNQSLNLAFHELYENEGLQKLDKKFHDFFQQKNIDLYNKFISLKLDSKVFTKKDQSVILIEAAKIIEDFLVYVFAIEKENNVLKKAHLDTKKISFARREFVQRIVAKNFKESPLNIDRSLILKELKVFAIEAEEIEKTLAQNIFLLLEKENSNDEKKENEEQIQSESRKIEQKNNWQKEFELLSLYSAWALYSIEGKAFHKGGILFNLPKKIDYENLVSSDFFGKNSNYSGANDANFIEAQNFSTAFATKKRDGFNLTDQGFSLSQATAEASYCIFCHNQEKDSCRLGLKDKDGSCKKNPLQIELKGCPLDQKISEMNLLKSEGFSLASLVVAALDNPMIAGTGHRICNDCMKSCIFQKQDPVNIPQIETENLKDILNLPFGFEIYSLLTRWNPLNFSTPFVKKNSGKKILVVGLGPAGYTLAHYLLNEGHDVVAIDGLKIEPLDPLISGIDEFGKRQKFKPIKFLDEIYESLESRLIQGFGGVSEYGITSRWNKNFLKIIRLLLERRKNFSMFGGIRFGSSINDKIAFDEYGFDHVALCVGAGRPNIVNLKNHYAKGVRSASDFLMSLQLNGAFKKDLFTNLQIRMPIVVIGAGLTAVDTATESQEYYFRQIEKFKEKFEKLKTVFGEEKIWKNLSLEEKNIAQEFLEDAAILESESISGLGKEKILQKYNGVKILYRKKIQNSPSYKLNHEELIKAFEQQIQFIENIEPEEVMIDEFNHIKAIKCKDGEVFECRSLLIAAGTAPNISAVLEDQLDFELEGKYFKAIEKNSVITKIDAKNRAVSFFGDLHPDFEGNVVKAMASAKFGYKIVDQILNSCKSNTESDLEKISQNKSLDKNDYFLQKINTDFRVKIQKINRLSDNVVEVFVRAPLFAKNTQIGQIFRLQNYHALAKKNNDKIMAMEGVVVTALSVDKVNGIISGIVVETGGSASLIKNFQENEPCVFMGPSGKPTEIVKNETVVLIGGGRGNMPLTAIAEIYKNHGCRIIFFAGYRKNEYVLNQARMEKASDVLVYAIEEELVATKMNRPQDKIYQGAVTEAIKKYFTENNEKIDRIFTIGGNKMMAEIARLRHENIVASFNEAKVAISSLNAPMQCMLKGVCSQCLQKRKNDLGEFEYFYSCANQDQNMDRLDFAHLHARCEQNSLQEKITKMWLSVI